MVKKEADPFTAPRPHVLDILNSLKELNASEIVLLTVRIRNEIERRRRHGRKVDDSLTFLCDVCSIGSRA